MRSASLRTRKLNCGSRRMLVRRFGFMSVHDVCRASRAWLAEM
jgi:hypothetical protein